MGKTKTAFVTGVAEEAKSGEEKYKQKQAKKKLADEKQKQQVTGLGLKGGERIKVIGGESPEEVESTTPESIKAKAKKEKVRGKKYQEAKAKVDKNKLYPIPDAITLVRETSFSKFDATLEMHLVVKKTGLSANVTLPYQTGKAKKIEVADEKTIEKLKTGKIDFDVLLATAEMMPLLVPFAKILGPKGLMPNPKNGTLIKKVAEASKFSANSLSLKTEKEAPLIHTAVGKLSQKDEELLKNIEAILDGVDRKQIIKAYLKATMSPSVKIQI